MSNTTGAAVQHATTVNVANHKVGRIGFGLMGLTTGGNFPSQEDALETMKAAADSGATIWSSAAFYNLPNNPYGNIKLIRAFFDKWPEYKDKIVLVIKGGFDYKAFQPFEDLERLRNEIKDMKAILGDKSIDVFSYARAPPKSVEQTYTELVQLKEEGLFDAIGASELSAQSLKAASKITPIAIVEIELSLFSFEPAIREVLQYSNETGLPIFAYSPLGRGFLTGNIKSAADIPKGSFLNMVPRYQEEAINQNLKLVEKVREIADKKGVSPSQLALAWIINVSDYTIPIPGSSKVSRVKENGAAADIKLSKQELEELQAFLDSFEPQGTRYPEIGMSQLMK